MTNDRFRGIKATVILIVVLTIVFGLAALTGNPSGAYGLLAKLVLGVSLLVASVQVVLFVTREKRDSEMPKTLSFATIFAMSCMFYVAAYFFIRKATMSNVDIMAVLNRNFLYAAGLVVVSLIDFRVLQYLSSLLKEESPPKNQVLNELAVIGGLPLAYILIVSVGTPLVASHMGYNTEDCILIILSVVLPSLVKFTSYFIPVMREIKIQEAQKQTKS